MLYTAIDTFYLTDEQLKNSPSGKDGIDEPAETNLRIYGCDLIQESGILLRLPQAVMATGQVLFHRFYCKKSFARFGVKRVAASCVWLASKLEECPRKAKYILVVFHRMECRRENMPTVHLDVYSKRYSELKHDLIRTERHLLKEMAFICHVEHPHKFISNYLVALETPPELKQEAWNLANDSLRTTLCVRFKSEVIACGVVYAAARRFQVPLPENPPWWLVFDADKAGIEEVCRVLAHLYTLPKAQYVSVCKDNDSFTMIKKAPDSQSKSTKEVALDGSVNDGNTVHASVNADVMRGDSKPAADMPTELKKNDHITLDGEEVKENVTLKSKIEHRTDTNIDKYRERDKERSKGRDRDRTREHESSRGRDSERERDREKQQEREREKLKDRSHRSKEKDSGHSDKSKHHSSRDRSDYRSSYSSREKDRYRYHPYS